MLRIFVSSTFNDMHIERDCLEDIEQDINTRLMDYGERVEFVDLRWGICTEELDDEGKNRAVLEGCFSAIDKSDYLLIFLGNRYGTIKGYDDVIGYLGKKRTDVLFKDCDTGKSVTELEVTYAQLVKGHNANNTVVCIREEQEVEMEAQHFINRFTLDSEYDKSIVQYTYNEKELFKNKLKSKFLKMLESHIKNNSRFDRDFRRLSNIAVEAILNSRLDSYVMENQMLIFSGGKGIGKTVTAAKILEGGSRDDTLYFVTWEAKRKSITYEQLLNMVGTAFSEMYEENYDLKNVKKYVKKCITRVIESGKEFVLFLDSEPNITNINYKELLAILGNGRLVIATDDHSRILSTIPSFNDYKIIESKDILFETGEIANVIKNEFEEHDKTIRKETIDILCQKRDITKPLYLHFVIKRLLFLKAYDFEKCGVDESPEVKVLSEIAREMPNQLNDLLRYSIRNIHKNSDIRNEMSLAIQLLAESYGGVTDEVLIDFLIYNNVGCDKNAVLPYVYEIKNRLEDFIESDGEWLYCKFESVVYNWVVNGTGIKKFIEDHRTDYKNEYYIREYLYWNRENAEKMYLFLSARPLWKFENTTIRRIYRECFWNLVEDGFIRIDVVDEKFFMKLLNKYQDDFEDFILVTISGNDSVFRILSEKLEKEIHNFEREDGIAFLLRMIEICLNELLYINKSGILTCLNDIPMEVLKVFERLAFLYKTISKALLNIEYTNWDLRKIYEDLLEMTIDYSDLINGLSCAEELINSKDSRSITYYQNAVRLVSASDFFVHLGDYDVRFKSDKNFYNNGIYFNWKYKDDRIFDTVKYTLLYSFTRWVENFNRIESQFAMDIVAIDYYVSYARRTSLMDEYEDAVILSLCFAYELYKLDHFRRFDDSIEKYWIDSYPYTRLEYCSSPEEVKGYDFEIRMTVFNTICELGKAFDKSDKSGVVSLREKCVLDILKITLSNIVENVQMTDKHKQEILSQLFKSKSFEEYRNLKETLNNSDLKDYLPKEYLSVIKQDELIIRKAVKELNFNCIYGRGNYVDS